MICPIKNENVPHWRPVVMSGIFYTRDYLKAVDQRDVNICESGCLFIDRSTCDYEMFELLIIQIIIISAILLIYMSENNLAPPTSDQEGLELYNAI